MTSIEHWETSAKTTLVVSFEYDHPTKAVGEPHKITREDGSYIDLVYDAALRLRSETYFSSTATGNQLVRTITYAYDEAGNRTSRTIDGAEDLYTADPLSDYLLGSHEGIDGIAGNSDDGDYGYDVGGRLTSLERNDDPWSLGYNAAGQVTNIDNVGTGGSEVNLTFAYDALGRRTSATVGSNAYDYLIAPAAQRLGAGVLDVEVQHLATDGNGGLLQGWVYAGENPILRYEPDGAGGYDVKYYLEDASDSIRGLLNSSGTLVESYDYDAFGNVPNGVNPSSAAGGDFGFHAAWRDDATGLYHMRARSYDPVTGRFLTPDPAEPNPQVPESYNPYAFANSNPHLFSDPTGLFSITEINVSSHIQQNLGKLNNLAVQRARTFVIDKVEEVVAESLVNLLGRLIPGFGNVDLAALNDIEAAGLSSRLGTMFQDFVQHTVCDTIGASGGIANSFWIEPIVARNGRVVNSGLNCSNLGNVGNYLRDLTTEERFTPRPDYIINPNDPQQGGTYLIGDMTLSAEGLYRKYVAPGKQPGQWQAITNHASNFGFNVSLFITFREGSEATFTALSAKLRESSLREGVLIYVLSLIE